MTHIRVVTENSALAADICRLAEAHYRQGIEPDVSYYICKEYFKDRQPDERLFYKAVKEALDMMQINPGWGL